MRVEDEGGINEIDDGRGDCDEMDEEMIWAVQTIAAVGNDGLGWIKLEMKCPDDA